MADFSQALDPKNLAIFSSLNSPFEIQAYLDSLPYVGEERNRSPLAVMQDCQCHCLDGGLLAALALQRIGFAPQIIDLVPEPNTDDDHVLAIYQIDGHYGAVAKSNFSALRFREPVYRGIRELVMSYFDVFFNVDGLKTMRAYTRPLNLTRCDLFDWQTTDTGVEVVSRRLYSLKQIPVITPAMRTRLSRMDERAYQANMLGVKMDGLYKGTSVH